MTKEEAQDFVGEALPVLEILEEEEEETPKFVKGKKK